MQVLTRYLLQKLFGPGVANVTSNHTILYLDLPSNMVCPLKQYGNNILKSAIYIKFIISIAFLTIQLKINACGRWVQIENF